MSTPIFGSPFLAVLLVARPRKRFLPALGLAGLIAAGLVFAALLANSLN